MTLTQRLKIEPHTDEVQRLNSWLDAGLQAAGTQSQTANDLKLCINEAIANLISYAFGGIKSPVIVIELSLDTNSAKAVVFDNGASFDLKNWPEPDKPKSLKDLKPGGFGISLIRERARKLVYETTGSLNKLTIECGSDQ